MREHRALRPPGGARRIEDHRGVLLADIGGLAAAARGRRDRKTAKHAHRHRRRSDASDREHRWRPADGRPKRGLMDQEPWRRSRSAHRRSRASAAGCRAAPSPGPRLAAAEHRQHELDAVAEQQRDAGRRAAGRASETPPRSLADCCATSRQVIRRSPQTSASPSGFRAAASATIAQMLFGRSQNAGTTRSPKRASSRIAGMECCDQSIAAPPSQLLAFMP